MAPQAQAAMHTVTVLQLNSPGNPTLPASVPGDQTSEPLSLLPSPTPPTQPPYLWLQVTRLHSTISTPCYRCLGIVQPLEVVEATSVRCKQAQQSL